MFYLKIKIESFRKAESLKYRICQRFGYGSHNCGHHQRCVKCAGDHNFKECTKVIEQGPMCCNCDEKYTTNVYSSKAILAKYYSNLKINKQLQETCASNIISKKHSTKFIH